MRYLAILTSCGMLVAIASCSKETSNDVEKVVIEKEKHLLDEWGMGHTMVFVENSAEDITYFDPSLVKRLDGRRAFIGLLGPIENTFTVDRYEMIDPKVQAYGEVAILTFNLVDYSRNNQGEEQKTSWNATEVYRRAGNAWQIVHSHWSFTNPDIRR